MKKFSTLLLLFISHLSFSQNLVSNGSFEDTVACPPGLGAIYDAIGWSSYRRTPDYFNACNTSTNGTDYVGVPYNFFGYRTAQDGNAYAGLYAFAKTDLNGREIIGSELNQQLTIGQKYFLSFYVSRAFDSFLGINVATNKLGARFSTISYSDSSFSLSDAVPNDNRAQVFTDSVVTDTLNWTKISGSFIADSAYNYISLGNFFTDSATTEIYMDTAAEYAYYYIDDIRLSTDSNFVNAINEYDSVGHMSVFPNPARDWISIRGNDIQSLVLYDVLGRMVYTSNSEFISPVTINTSFLPRAMYFLKTKTKSTVVTQKLILQ